MCRNDGLLKFCGGSRLSSLLTLLDKSASREVLKAHPVFPSSAIMAMPMAVAMAMTTPTRLASPFTAARPVPSFR